MKTETLYNMKHTITTLTLAMAVASHAAAQLTSPNGKVTWRECVKGNPTKGFAIDYRDGNKTTTVLTITAIGMTTKDGGGKDLRHVATTATEKHEDSYTMKGGKRTICRNNANGQTITFADSNGRKMKMQIRAYDDGVAFRYVFDNLYHTRTDQELTTFRIEEGTNRWMQKWSVGYEDFFPLTTTGGGKNRRWAYPALFKRTDNVWALITEGGVEGCNSASSLYNDKDSTLYRVVTDCNNQNVTGHWASPWRIVVTGSLADVVESTLVTDVSAPCRLSDTEWIKPGSVSWIYWAHNHGSNDYQIVKQYVDMAAEMKWQYVLIDAEWDDMANGGNIHDALRYCREKGVKPIIWYNSSTGWTKRQGAPGPHERLNAPERREREFAWLEKEGVAGVKIDFFDGDGQETMQYCIDLLEAAARHRLMVNFHGATIPRGWQRTYPNLMTVEGVYGAEWYNNKPVLTDKAAAHNATLPFTRNVVGPMDYTPCTFSDSQHPHITTHCHELALPVVFESSLLHWADRPESYLVQPKEVKDFMASLPTVWDETRLVSGYPADHIAIARRSGNTWYIAGINGTDEAKTIDLDLAFVRKGRYTLFTDSGDKEKPWRLKNGKGRLPLKITCLPRGGFVMVIR